MADLSSVLTHTSKHVCISTAYNAPGEMARLRQEGSIESTKSGNLEKFIKSLSAFGSQVRFEKEDQLLLYIDEISMDVEGLPKIRKQDKETINEERREGVL